jgi:hypothetical protein
LAGNGGGELAAAAGRTGRLIRRGPAATAAGGGGTISIAGAAVGSATESGKIWVRISLASWVPSAPQAGQLTEAGISPFSGSTSKMYFCPQPQTILMSMWPRFSVQTSVRREFTRRILGLKTSGVHSFSCFKPDFPLFFRATQLNLRGRKWL